MSLLWRSVRLDEVASVQMDEAPAMIGIITGLLVAADGVLAPRAEHFSRGCLRWGQEESLLTCMNSFSGEEETLQPTASPSPLRLLYHVPPVASLDSAGVGERSLVGE